MFIFPQAVKRGQPLSFVPILHWPTPFDHICVWNILIISFADFSSALNNKYAASLMSKRPLLFAMLAASLFSLWLLFCWRTFLMNAFVLSFYQHVSALTSRFAPFFQLKNFHSIKFPRKIMWTAILELRNEHQKRNAKKRKKPKSNLSSDWFCYSFVIECVYSFFVWMRAEEKNSMW